ncbi:hypothetical protein D6850_11905 [Roseovarius spongiae]|uniref:Uncharacterized protein n=1 Tax=Roseovarius spongiae TaxID=2320272 RepID=A0A3A8ATF1_9RHOB|nr:hypothetical protein [Roseovarius spongiae]RKF13890.1 hypothetical protein D6850_11905 [Roseovarius spongiae]
MRVLRPGVIALILTWCLLSPAHAEFTYKPLKEPNYRVWEGKHLSKWLQGNVKAPFREVLVVFPVGKELAICDNVIFERNAKYSIRGQWELLEAKIEGRKITFELEAEGEAEASYIRHAGTGMQTIDFEEPVWKSFPAGGFYEAQAKRLCLSSNGNRRCEPASRAGVPPLYVVGILADKTASRQMICSYFAFISNPDRKD